MYFVHLPLTLTTPGNSTWSLNLNIYRNTHYRTLNAMKRLFEVEVESSIRDIPVMDKISIEYVLYPKTSRALDIGNVLTVVDKFFSDLLVNTGKIPDDNFKHIIKISFAYGEPCPTNPHALALIIPQE